MKISILFEKQNITKQNQGITKRRIITHKAETHRDFINKITGFVYLTRKTHNIERKIASLEQSISDGFKIAFSTYIEYDIDFLDKSNIPIGRNSMCCILFGWVYQLERTLLFHRLLMMYHLLDLWKKKEGILLFFSNLNKRNSYRVQFDHERQLN